MADNIELDAGSGGAILAADDISSVWYQIEKLAFGPLNTATLVTATVGLPVNIVDADQNAILGTGTYSEATTVGTVIGAVRNDSLEALAGTDNEIAPFQVNAAGALYVEVATQATGAVTNTGTFVVQVDGAALTALQLIDNIVQVEDVQHSTGDSGVMLLGVENEDQAALTAGDKDYTPIAVTPEGNVIVKQEGNITVNAHAVTNAGTFVVQVDGAALTALQLIDNIVQVEDVQHSTGDSGVMLLGVENEDQAALTAGDKDYTPIAVTPEGNVIVKQEGNVTVNAHAVTNAGTFAVQVDGAALTALQLIDNPVNVLGTATYSETSTSAMVAGAVRNDALDALAGTDNEIAPFQVSALGALYTTLAPETSGGLSIYKNIDVDESEDAVKSSPGQMYAIYAFNSTAAAIFLKLYNDNPAGVVVGTTVPDMTLPIPGNADSDGAGFTWNFPHGVAFSDSDGFTVACTGAIADNDATAIGANACAITILYK